MPLAADSAGNRAADSPTDRPRPEASNLIVLELVVGGVGRARALRHRRALQELRRGLARLAGRALCRTTLDLRLQFDDADVYVGLPAKPFGNHGGLRGGGRPHGHALRARLD